MQPYDPRRFLTLVESCLDRLEAELPQLEEMTAKQPHWCIGWIETQHELIALCLELRDELLEEIAELEDAAA